MVYFLMVNLVKRFFFINLNNVIQFHYLKSQSHHNQQSQSEMLIYLKS